jgi:hypothetical protein
MPEFISKLQHYISEKGEFTDEKVRSLVQTIELIKNFTWDEERSFADFKITGPSVTIRDEDLNYLKVGLYTDGLFNIYFLDNDNHLYENHISDIYTIFNEVSSFFNGQIDPQKYKKHFFNIDNRTNFITKDFRYKVKLLNVLWSGVLQIIPFLFILLLLVEQSPNASFNERIFLIILLLLSGAPCAYILNRYLVRSNQTIQISKGNDIFYFAQGINETKYNKNDIDKIIIYQPGGRKKLHFFYVFEIYFKDGSVLKFSNMLISEGNFMNKFPDDLYSYTSKSTFWRL